MRGAGVVLALACLMLAGEACGGPTLPSGAAWISYQRVSSGGPATDRENILAATSLAAIRAQVLSAPHRYPASEQCGQEGDPSVPPCWPDAVQQTNLLYIAVSYFYSCTNDTSDGMALGGRTIYFVHWIGPPRGTCNAALAGPSYTLYTVERGRVPASGTLAVELLIEDSSSGTSVAAETSVALD